MLALFLSAALAGPIIEPTPEAVRTGESAAWHLALLVGLVLVPVCVWLFVSRLRKLRQALSQADQNRMSP